MAQQLPLFTHTHTHGERRFPAPLSDVPVNFHCVCKRPEGTEEFHKMVCDRTGLAVTPSCDEMTNTVHKRYDHHSLVCVVF